MRETSHVNTRSIPGEHSPDSHHFPHSHPHLHLVTPMTSSPHRAQLTHTPATQPASAAPQKKHSQQRPHRARSWNSQPQWRWHSRVRATTTTRFFPTEARGLVFQRCAPETRAMYASRFRRNISSRGRARAEFRESARLH